MTYFAYGSNMLEERLKATNRVPNAALLCTGLVHGWTMRFEKRSIDRSAKCNIAQSESSADTVHGVVFEVPESELPALAYVADPDAIDRSLQPYCWSQELVVARAAQHRLPQNYIAQLRAFSCKDDPNPNRATKLEADQALAAYRQSMRHP